MEVHSSKCLPQETRTIPNKQPNITPLGTRKEQSRFKVKDSQQRLEHK